MTAVLIAALLIAAGAARAHEIGTTQVRFVLHKDNRWTAEITTPPTPLLHRLQAAADEPLSGTLDEAALREKLEAFRDAIARKVHVAFDGAASPVSLSVAWIGQPTDINQPLAAVLLAQGPVPPKARHVTWQYDLVASTYAVQFSAQGRRGSQTQWLESDAQSPPFAVLTTIAPPTVPEIVAQYLTLGFRHIVPEGLDHILFVLGLFLLSTQWRPLLTQVTSFTVAHSVTLGLTMYGVLSLSPRVVEPLIALSIAYVAIENIATPRLTPWRPAVVFGFGLLHGMGFAGVLRELALPRSQFLPALVSFNVGIELAQLSIIAAAFLAVAAWHRNKAWYRPRFVLPASAAIAATGLFWTVERIVT